MEKLVLISTMLLSFLSLNGQTGNPDSLARRVINAGTVDPSLAMEQENHRVFFNPTCSSNDRLLLYLMGTFDIPDSTTYFPSLAANHGIRAIVLNYKNGVPTSICSNSFNLACHDNFRQEIVFGTPTSLVVNVDSTNSIYTRFEKLLQYLHANFPSENWGQFLDNSQQVDWSRITSAGHSQGGGHAVYLGKAYELERVLPFASPNEYNDNQGQSAPWILTAGATPPAQHYAFANLYDDVVDFAGFYTVWNDLNLLPLGDTFQVDGRTCADLASHMLYTTDTTRNSNVAAFHSLVVRDSETPLDSAGVPVFTDVWKYMLGICDTIGTALNEAVEMPALRWDWDWERPLFRIESDLPMQAIAVCNLKGQCFHTAIHSEGFAEAELHPGLYFLRIQFLDGRFEARKILLK